MGCKWLIVLLVSAGTLMGVCPRYYHGMLKWSARAIPSAPSTSHTTCCYSRQILIEAVRTVTVTCTVDRHQATITAAPDRLTVPQVGLKTVAADVVNV